jgi:hypothetical protein
MKIKYFIFERVIVYNLLILFLCFFLCDLNAQPNQQKWAINSNFGIGHGLKGHVSLFSQLDPPDQLSINYLLNLQLQRFLLNGKLAISFDLQQRFWSENIQIADIEGNVLDGAKHLLLFAGFGGGLQFRGWQSRSRKRRLFILTAYHFNRVFRERIVHETQSNQWVSSNNSIDATLQTLSLGVDYSQVFWQSTRKDRAIEWNFQMQTFGGRISYKYFDNSSNIISLNISAGLRLYF